MKTVIGVGYCLRTLSARVVNIFCDKQRKQKKSAKPLTAQKKPQKATASHFSKKASHYPQILIGQGLDIRTCNVHKTRIFIMVQKPTGSWKELFDEYKKERWQRWLKVAYPNTGGTVRWNVFCYLRNVLDKKADGNTTCENTCGVNFRWTIDPVPSLRASATCPSLRKTSQGCINLANM